jgi:hypothetical protein
MGINDKRKQVNFNSSVVRLKAVTPRLKIGLFSESEAFYSKEIEKFIVDPK